jgi:hypothetical protein
MRKKYLVVVAVAVLLAALAWLLARAPIPLTGAGGSGTSTPPTEKPAQILASIEVEGRGSVLANGTSTLYWNSTKPFKLELEARPEACWIFKGWLVNGSLYSAQPNATLLVKGNTTVKAVFERPVYAVSLVPVFHPATLGANASARINGTLHPLPVNANAPACSLLEVEPVAPKSWVALNGTLRFTVNGSATLRLAFEKVAAVLALRGLLVPVEVSGTVNGTPASLVVGGVERPDAELLAAFGSQVSIYPRSDPKGCALYNDTHLVCFDGWIVNGTPYGGFQLSFTVNGDTLVEMQTEITKKQQPAAYTEVLLPNGSLVKVPVIPAEQYLIVPFYGEYEYVGNGWFKIKGVEKSGWTVYQFIIILPEGWRRIRITANYTRMDEHASTPDIEVLCKRLSAGLFLAPSHFPGTKVNVFEIDRGFVECIGDTPFNPIPSAPEDMVVLRCMSKHIKRVANCSGPTISGNTASFFNAPVGSLLLTGEDGVIYLKIEILEMGG